MRQWDVIVVGGGHAGYEAALAARRMGCSVLMVTLTPETIAEMPCNPAIGGLAKSHLVREIDALGGVMALATDAGGIQYRVLNTRKGPAVRATRVQQDRPHYAAAVRRALEEWGVVIRPGEVTEVLTRETNLGPRRGFQRGPRITDGIRTADGQVHLGRTVVLTTGTFLRGLLYFGLETRPGGRFGEPPAKALSASLRALGLQLGRLKTGTPPRLLRDTLDFEAMERQPGLVPPPKMSFHGPKPPLPQVACHITHTTPETAEVIRRNLDRSPLYTGLIEGTGPRYCPSIEDKVVKFPHRQTHHIFIEPEGLDSPLVYPNGISTSLPPDVQRAILATIPGLERAKIARYGYAVEYDFVEPTQLDPTLEVKGVAGLFLAGQLIGTSGYEEAAALGLVAGLNAARSVRGEDPVVFRRDQAYIGVLVDDLVTKGTQEPYRLFTSRAEFRLLLREDNADERLCPLAIRLGVLPEPARRAFQERQALLERARERLRKTVLKPVAEVNRTLAGLGSPALRKPASAADLLRRPEISYRDLEEAGWAEPGLAEDLRRRIETEMKYEGYLDRQRREAERLREYDSLEIPEDFDYTGVPGLNLELQEKLSRQRPKTLGQASRIPGMTPAATAVLLLQLRRPDLRQTRDARNR